MSAPAGWHLQPDGQERYWDGTRWTDEFRAPLPSDPTAPPADPSWTSSVDETQALDVNSTQAIPAPAAPEQPAWSADPTQQGQAPQPGYHPPVQDQAQPAQQGYGYPATGYGAPQTGYGAPGGQPYAPPPQQGSGLAKGCLIAALVGRARRRRRHRRGDLRLQPHGRDDQQQPAQRFPHRAPDRLPDRRAHRGAGPTGRHRGRRRLRAAARERAVRLVAGGAGQRHPDRQRGGHEGRRLLR